MSVRPVRGSWLGMKVWLRRLLFTAVFLFWCSFMLLPTIFFVGLADGQMVWGDDPHDQIRLFLMQKPGQEGLGLQWSRPVTADKACVQTTVRYFMFAGEAANNDLCTCLAPPNSGDVPEMCALP